MPTQPNKEEVKPTKAFAAYKNGVIHHIYHEGEIVHQDHYLYLDCYEVLITPVQPKETNE